MAQFSLPMQRRADPKDALAQMLIARGTQPVSTIGEGVSGLASLIAGSMAMKRGDARRLQSSKASLGAMIGQLPQDQQAKFAQFAASDDPATIELGTMLAGQQLTTDNRETFGAPVAGISGGKPTFMRPGNRGTMQAVEGFEPSPQSADTPSPVKNYAFRQGLVKEFGEGSPNVKQFDSYVRALQQANLGDRVAIINPADPGNPAATLAKGVPPEQTPEVKGAQTTAVGRAETDVKREGGLSKAKAALSGLETQAGVVIENIDKALNLVENSWSATGVPAVVMGNLPNTDARALQNHLNTIKANVGFDRLQQMRDASPTGGALGNVSEMENKLLQAVNGALDPLQTDQLAENLKSIKQLYGAVMKERREAFQKDYGDKVATPGMPKVTNDDDYAKLPSGTRFLDPTGQERVKP